MSRAKNNRKTKGKVAYKKRNTRKNKKGTRKLKGGCGCNTGLIKGGNINPPSFDGNLPIRYYYGQNDYQNDPTAPNAIESARNLPGIIKGGKRRNNKNKKIKGGDMLLGSAYSNNPFVSFGTTDGARNAVDVLYGSTTTNPSVYNQPTLNGHTSNNPPLA